MGLCSAINPLSDFYFQRQRAINTPALPENLLNLLMVFLSPTTKDERVMMFLPMCLFILSVPLAKMSREPQILMNLFRI